MRQSLIFIIFTINLNVLHQEIRANIFWSEISDNLKTVSINNYFLSNQHDTFLKSDSTIKWCLLVLCMIL
ncbi:hypothetical protein GMMP15_110004 [Candidatus Magnetomoraceae bacterium gMMP-15]